MQQAGIAEADPSLDVEGWDAAAKITALANVLMDARIRPADVDRTGITRVDAERPSGRRCRRTAAAAGRDGQTRRRPGRDPRRPDAAARPATCSPSLPGMANALTFETDLLEDVTVVQGGGGLVADGVRAAVGPAQPSRARVSAARSAASSNPLHDHPVDDGQRDRPVAQRDQLVVGRVVFLDVRAAKPTPSRESHAFTRSQAVQVLPV